MKKKNPSFLEMYSKLINVSSISSENPVFDQSNKKIIELLAEWLENIGFKINIQKIQKNKKKFNLIAKIGSGEGGLLLSGHSDTVNYNEKLWKSNPFELTIVNNKFYGLGAVDMKGFFACILDLMTKIEIKKIKKPIYLLVTADEETSMLGVKFFLKFSTISPDLIIVGEPTNLVPIVGHKGNITKKIITLGNSGHSSDSEKINSINLMHETIFYLLKIKKKIKDFVFQKKFKVPYSTMNFGYIKGGHSSNTICEFCELHIDIRLLPKFPYKIFNEIFNEYLLPIKKKWGGYIKIHNLHPPIPSYEISIKHEKIIKTIEKITKEKKTVVNYCSEASYLHKIAPTILLGPGSIKQAHQPNEFLELSYVKKTKKIIKKIIEFICFL
ncbi:Acetylornithine deacetylase [Buchnera aphidicola (Tetraneura ulmi)]|uniref:acetylornithine deacetylase n=1 Tax=Buchnera aphidicola TaxID=9 RepID=UPI003463D614